MWQQMGHTFCNSWDRPSFARGFYRIEYDIQGLCSSATGYYDLWTFLLRFQQEVSGGEVPGEPR